MLMALPLVSGLVLTVRVTVGVAASSCSAAAAVGWMQREIVTAPTRNDSHPTTPALTLTPARTDNSGLGSIIARVCSVCARQLSKYSCPRCNAQSCSLPCYQRHSSQCVEVFQSQSLQQSMRGLRADTDTQRRMNEILQRLRQHPADTGIDTPDDSGSDTQALIETALNGTLSLESLTEEQRRDFERAVIDGRLSKYIDQYQPFWAPSTGDDNRWLPHTIVNVPQSSSLIEIVDDIDSDASGTASAWRQWCGSLPAVTSLLPTTVSPSPFLPALITQPLFALAFLHRIHNGELLSDESSGDSADVSMIAIELLSLTPSLASNQPPALVDPMDCRPLLNQSLQCLSSQPTLAVSQWFHSLILRDTAQLCLNYQFLQRALHECHQLLTLGEQALAAKKVYFYACYCMTNVAQVKSTFSVLGMKISEFYIAEQLRVDVAMQQPANARGSHSSGASDRIVELQQR